MRTWTDGEIIRLKNMYKKGCPATYIAQRLDRTVPAVQDKAHRLGLNRQPENVWTADEIAVLRSMYEDPHYDNNDIAQRLNRTRLAVRQKAQRLGLTIIHKGGWTDDDVKYLKTLCADPDYTKTDIAWALGRSESAVHFKIWQQGLKNVTNNTWTADEVAKLENMYYDGDLTIGDIAEKLGRNKKSVFEKAKRLGLCYRRSHLWTPDEDEVLISMHESYRYADIAKVLGRTKNSVTSRAKYLGLRKENAVRVLESGARCPECNSITLMRRVRKGGYICKRCSAKVNDDEALAYGKWFDKKHNGSYKVPWSQEEKQFLKDNPEMDLEEIAKRLGRTASSVRAMRKALKVRRWEQKRWTDADIQYLKDNWDKKTKKQLADELNVTHQQIVYMGRRYGLRSAPRGCLNITDDVLETIKQRYPVEDTEMLAGELGFSTARLHTIASYYNIKKLPPYLKIRIKNEQEMGYCEPLLQQGEQ